jgi:hypothetical protein
VAREVQELPELREPQQQVTLQVQAVPRAPARALVERAPVAAQQVPVAQWVAQVEQPALPVARLAVLVELVAVLVALVAQPAERAEQLAVAPAALKFLQSKKGSQPNSVESLSYFYRDVASNFKFLPVT